MTTKEGAVGSRQDVPKTTTDSQPREEKSIPMPKSEQVTGKKHGKIE